MPEILVWFRNSYLSPCYLTQAVLRGLSIGFIQTCEHGRQGTSLLCQSGVIMSVFIDWLQSYYILVASLTLMALFYL